MPRDETSAVGSGPAAGPGHVAGLGRRGRSSPALALPVLALLALGAVGLVGCSRDDGSGGGVRLPSEVAVDTCGNDLSELTTTVRGVDPATGSVRWTTSVPLVDHYLLRSGSGNPQLPLQGRSVEVELDPATGEVLSYPPAGAHEVLVDISRLELSVDGDVQPDAPVVGGLTLSTGYGAMVDGAQHLVATDATGAVVWQLDLSSGGNGGTGGSVSRPTVFGDVVVVTASPAQPSCGPKS